MNKIFDMDDNELFTNNIVYHDENCKEYEVCKILESNKFINEYDEIINASECFIIGSGLDLDV